MFQIYFQRALKNMHAFQNNSIHAGELKKYCGQSLKYEVSHSSLHDIFQNKNIFLNLPYSIRCFKTIFGTGNFIMKFITLTNNYGLKQPLQKKLKFCITQYSYKSQVMYF